MHDETRHLLDAVRNAEDPTPADAERVARALRAAIAADVAPGLAQPGRSEAWAGDVLRGLAKTVRLERSVFAFCAAAAFGTGDGDVSSRPAVPERSSVSVLPAAAPVPAPPAAVPATEGAQPSHGALPRSAAEAPPTPRAPRPATTARRAPSSLRAELDLLREVQAALDRADGAAALRALDAQPSTAGQLLAERQAARVLALCLVGDTAEARDAAARFLNAHPASVHRHAIERSCANPRRID
jgi:hypothetical protein